MREKYETHKLDLMMVNELRVVMKPHHIEYFNKFTIYKVSR